MNEIAIRSIMKECQSATTVDRIFARYFSKPIPQQQDKRKPQFFKVCSSNLNVETGK